MEGREKQSRGKRGTRGQKEEDKKREGRQIHTHAHIKTHPYS